MARQITLIKKNCLQILLTVYHLENIVDNTHHAEGRVDPDDLAKKIRHWF
jgi:hypothetical protein